MKAILEFNLPEEREEFEITNRASKMHAFITDLDNELRSGLKHGFQAGMTLEKYAQWIRDSIRDYLPEIE